MLTQNQITELCMSDRQDLIDVINKECSNRKKKSVFRSTHGFSKEITPQQVIENFDRLFITY